MYACGLFKSMFPTFQTDKIFPVILQLWFLSLIAFGQRK